MNDFYDPEVPAGFQDADFEMTALTETANRISRLRKRGICLHGSIQGPPGPPSKPTTVWTCHDCGKTWQSEKEYYTEYEELREHYLS